MPSALCATTLLRLIIHSILASGTKLKNQKNDTFNIGRGSSGGGRTQLGGRGGGGERERECAPGPRGGRGGGGGGGGGAPMSTASLAVSGVSARKFSVRS